MDRRTFLRAGSAGTLLGLYGCGGGDDIPPQQTASAVMQQQLDATAFSFGTQFGIPGLTASVYQRGTRVWSTALGIQVSGFPMQEGTTFPWASISKQFTSALALYLEQRGVINLNDPVTRWLPAPAAWSRVRLLNLLTHTAGIPDFTQDPAFSYFFFTGPPIGQLLNYFLQNYAPRIGPPAPFLYSNTGYFIAGCMLDVASGLLLEADIHSLFLTPLGMTTAFGLTAFSPTFTYPVGTSGGFLVPPVNAAWMHGCGSIVGSHLDLQKWCLSLQTASILSSGDIGVMTTPDVPAPIEPNAAYGLGLFIDVPGTSTDPKWFHSGSTAGFSDYMAIYTASGYSIVTLANASNIPMELLANRLRTLLG